MQTSLGLQDYICNNLTLWLFLAAGIIETVLICLIILLVWYNEQGNTFLTTLFCFLYTITGWEEPGFDNICVVQTSKKNRFPKIIRCSLLLIVRHYCSNISIVIYCISRYLSIQTTEQMFFLPCAYFNYMQNYCTEYLIELAFQTRNI